MIKKFLPAAPVIAYDAEKLKSRLEVKLNLLSEQMGPGLVVGPKDYIHDFNIPKCKIAHFGNLRGRNTYENCKWVAVIGRRQPSSTAVEDRARCYFGDDRKPLLLSGKLPNSPRGYRLRYRKRVGVMVQSHQDPRVDAFLRQVREAETIQAIDRLRLVFGGELGQFKPVFIISNVPVDITIDGVISLDDWLEGGSTMMKIWRQSQGTIPLSRKWLVEHHSDKLPSKFIGKMSPSSNDRRFKAILAEIRAPLYLATFPIDIPESVISNTHTLPGASVMAF